MTAPRNLLTLWAELLIDALVRAGVRHAVVSPGSRSTPFALAIARHPGLEHHVVIDERAAAFYALGIARVTGRAPLLLCTSGTAPAHYFPAVIEASESALPLVIVSADRPTALVGCGAPQTTEQRGLFGEHARFHADLGDPIATPTALRALARTAARAVSEANAGGPVHLNARADKPLEPQRATSDDERALEALAHAIRDESRNVASPRLAPDPSALDEIAARVAQAERPAIVAGPLALEAIALRAALFELCRSAGLALFAEASSQLRFAGTERAAVTCGDGFDRWLERAPSACPDVVIELGLTPTSAAWARWVERGGPAARFVAGGSRFRDPSGRADAIVLGDLASVVASLAERLPARAIDPGFASAITLEEGRAWAATEQALSETVALQEGTVTRTLAGSLPAGALLSLGSSLPIRHADRFVPGAADLRVLSQRGVNGIDGSIAAIAGAARVDGGPAALLIGDVTLAHDIGSLALAAQVTSPLAIVVIDNGGGRIFDQLPVASALSADELALFTTPPSIDVRAAAAAFGVRYAEATDAPSLRDALASALTIDRATLVHARVPPHGAAAIERRVTELFAEGA